MMFVLSSGQSSAHYHQCTNGVPATRVTARYTHLTTLHIMSIVQCHCCPSLASHLFSLIISSLFNLLFHTAYRPNRLYYSSRASCHPLPASPSDPDSADPLSSCSSSSFSCASSSNESSPSSERHHLGQHSHAAGSIQFTGKMTDCDRRSEGITNTTANTTTTVVQDEGQEMMPLDALTDTLFQCDSGAISKAVAGEADTDSPPTAAASAWTLTTARDSVQLCIEPRNGYVCFIGLDASSCELVLRPSHGDSTIDGRQAVLVFANGSFHIKDLNSSYGVSLYIFSTYYPFFIQLIE